MSCERTCEIYHKLPEGFREILEGTWVVECPSGYCETEKGCCYRLPEIIPIYLGAWNFKGHEEELNITPEELIKLLKTYDNIYVCYKNDYRVYDIEELCRYPGSQNVRFRYGLHVDGEKVYIVKFE
jgi:hypothetical protein